MAASTSGTGTETGTEGRLVLEATGPAASLERPVRFDADDVDRIELRLAGQTVLIVTSDHGEALREDDRAGHTYLDD